MHPTPPLPTPKARLFSAGGRRNPLLALAVVFGLALLLASATLLRGRDDDDNGITGRGRTYDYDGNDDDGAAAADDDSRSPKLELDCAAADVAPAAARRVFFSFTAQPSTPPPPRTRVIYFVPVEGATPLCALRSLGLVSSSSITHHNLLGRRKTSLPANAESDGGNNNISNIISSSNNTTTTTMTTSSTSDDVPRFRELLEMRERHQRLHDGMIFDAWYHAPLRSECVWRILRDWLLLLASGRDVSEDAKNPTAIARISLAGLFRWRASSSSSKASSVITTTTIIIPPGPQLAPWTVNDLAFANKLAPESTFVVLGGQTTTSTTLSKQYKQYRETCGDTPRWSESLEQPALRNPRLVCENAADIKASRMVFVDCSRGGGETRVARRGEARAG